MNLVKNRKTREYEFQRNKIKVFLLIPQKKSSQEMGVINNDASHFLCSEHKVCLPNMRYDVSLDEKRTARIAQAEDWVHGLKSGLYQNRADIARKNNCSRAWVTNVLKNQSDK